LTAAEGDVETVEGVIGDRQEDEGPLEDADEGESVEEFDLSGVGGGAFEGFKVGDEVFDEECADWDDAGERVQLAEEKGVALAGAEGLDTPNARNGGRCGGGCNFLVGSWESWWLWCFGFDSTCRHSYRFLRGLLSIIIGFSEKGSQGVGAFQSDGTKRTEDVLGKRGCNVRLGWAVLRTATLTVHGN